MAQPSSFALGLDAGGVQSFALGSASQVPTVPDSDDLEHMVPSLVLSDSSKFGSAAGGALEEPPPPDVNVAENVKPSSGGPAANACPAVKLGRPKSGEPKGALRVARVGRDPKPAFIGGGLRLEYRGKSDEVRATRCQRKVARCEGDASQGGVSDCYRLTREDGLTGIGRSYRIERQHNCLHGD